MATSVKGRISWAGARDAEGHREYTIKYLVKADLDDGPANVLQTPGLAVPGAFWIIDADVDLWAWCRPDAQVQQYNIKEGDPHRWWSVEQKFGTKPPDNQRCQDQQIENPLLEPQKVSGSFTKFSEEALFDRFGRRVLNSSFEQIRGAQAEFDSTRQQVRIEQNVALLQLDVVSAMKDTVNAFPLWGLPRRIIKLTGFSWERKFYGQCFLYYTRIFEFEIRYEGWDRDILDEGSKVLRGKWNLTTGLWQLDQIAGAAPNPLNPSHFDRFQDRKGDYARTILDGAGQPHSPDANTLIFTCDQCTAQGAPTTWRMTGIDSGESVQLSDTGGVCSWAGTDALLQTYSLSYNAGSSRWTITGSHIDTYFIDAANWNCYGPNTFTRLVPSGQRPYTLTIRAGSTPGTNHVEKYGEADFLLLGIPTSF